ncbi:MAG: hypothetical protein QOF84_4005, partial [Streptomyces sp.]|nr:hypothetical protein [Streptomyces sp.]
MEAAGPVGFGAVVRRTPAEPAEPFAAVRVLVAGHQSSGGPAGATALAVEVAVRVSVRGWAIPGSWYSSVSTRVRPG